MDFILLPMMMPVGVVAMGNIPKAAGSRARKAIGEVKKLVTDYRKASVAGVFRHIRILGVIPDEASKL